MRDSFDVRNTRQSVPDVSALSPYDMAYPVALLADGLKNKLQQAQLTAKEVYQAVVNQIPVLEQLWQAGETSVRYVVDMNETLLNAVESGKLKFTTENGGKMYAQLRQENGLYGEKVPIRREELSQSINYSQMATALQLGALQKQVESIAYQLVEIDCSVRAVLEGQQNDRMGLYYSGLSLYLEADACEDELFKKQALLQAIQTLAQASWQLRLTMEADIRFLANEAYKAHRGKSVQLIDERIQSIDQCFAVIHQASMLRAGIYCKIGEIGAMATTLKEYSGFIEGTVANNAMLLSQCDHRDKGTEDGIWQGRAALELDVAEIVKQLKNPEKTLYVGMQRRIHDKDYKGLFE